MSFCMGLLAAFLIAAKLMGIITCSWVLVLIPFWLPFALFVLVCFFLLIIVLCGAAIQV